MEIYERIIYLRKDILKLSQAKLGEKLGVSRDVINNIEQNRLARPEQKEPIYKLICSEFDISYTWLTKGIEPMRSVIDASAQSQIDAIMSGENEFAKNLFKEFSKLDKSEWELLEKIIKNISKYM